MTSALPPLPAPLARSLAEKGFDTLTPVQEAVLAHGLAGQDLLVSAQTGSGKTVAFGLAIAADLIPEGEMLPPPDTARALVIAPTRELALQVRREFEWLYAAAHAAIASCVGGMDARTERRALERGAHIVVGTPGRLRDHIERGSLDLSTVRAVVLDEADEMLDLGFREDLEFILQALPPERRTLLFSATVSPGIERLAQTYQRSARRIATESSRDAHADISYRALLVAPEDAEHAIVNVLRYYEAKNALVFCKTRAAVNHLTARFLNRGFPVVPLSGELAQEERARALQAMRDGRARVCVATDVAARGIDLPGLDLVIHADLPSNTETLLHRSGRTGRAGRKGVSILIVPTPARRKTERLLGLASLQAEWAGAPTPADVSARDVERLLTDELLTAPETPDEMGQITLLTERFTSRELAAAVARHYFAARSAPEDVAPVALDGSKPARPRAEFERSFWVRIAAGHNDRAEARWLLPMLCRSGNLTKTDIGAIRIQSDHTLAQLHEDCAERFWAAIGSGMVLDQGIPVSPADTPAEGDRPAPRPTRTEGSERPFKPRAPRAEGEERPYSPRPPRAEGGERPYTPRALQGEDRTDRPYTQRSEGERPFKPRTPRAEAGDRPYAPRAEGDRPFKPRTPRTEGGDRPSAPRAEGDRPFKPRTPRAEGGDRPSAPRAEGDRPFKPRTPRAEGGDRPYTPRAEGERPFKPRTPRAEGGDRPYTPRPDGEKPFKPRTKRSDAAGEAPKRDDRPARPRLDPEAARNPSARLSPGGKGPAKFGAKPGGKPSGKPFGKGPRPSGPGGTRSPSRPKG